MKKSLKNINKEQLLDCLFWEHAKAKYYQDRCEKLEKKIPRKWKITEKVGFAVFLYNFILFFISLYAQNMEYAILFLILSVWVWFLAREE